MARSYFRIILIRSRAKRTKFLANQQARFPRAAFMTQLAPRVEVVML